MNRLQNFVEQSVTGGKSNRAGYAFGPEKLSPSGENLDVRCNRPENTFSGLSSCLPSASADLLVGRVTSTCLSADVLQNVVWRRLDGPGSALSSHVAARMNQRPSLRKVPQSVQGNLLSGSVPMYRFWAPRTAGLVAKGREQ